MKSDAAGGLTDETDYFRLADNPEVGQTTQYKGVSRY
jgi:hypothetical protein